MDPIIFFSIVILVMSVVIHEVAHGYAALWQGDITAKYAGRLTLNPIKHIDPFGSIILPLLLILLNSGFVFGWAKPVPYNPYNLRNKRWGEFFVAAAGPASNLFLAIFFSVLIRLAGALSLSNSFIEISLLVVVINLVLAVFNLIPIPPLDGSKILYALLPFEKAEKFRHFVERYGLILIVILIFFLWRFILFLVFWLTMFLSGLSLFSIL